MTPRIERRAAPSLLSPARACGTGSLLDLMHEGFYLLFMLRHGSAPPAENGFMDKITQFLADFERDARQIRADGADIDAAKYAFCAAVDEIILSSPFAVRSDWERHPLQLVLFGDQLAGEHFFDRLEELRGKGEMRVQALQVFHMCLLLGFQGKYAIDDGDKLGYLCGRLGDEIAHIKGKGRGFAPRAQRPDQIAHKRRSDVPLWAMASLFALIAICAYLGLKSSLTHSTLNSLAGYADLVKLAPRPANLTLTLP
ncbi:type VI secretion system protein ImpK [Oxalobacteraceae bacterium GrIS 1.11]